MSVSLSLRKSEVYGDLCYVSERLEGLEVKKTEFDNINDAIAYYKKQAKIADPIEEKPQSKKRTSRKPKQDEEKSEE